MASKGGHDEVLTELINSGANVNAAAFTHTVPIQWMVPIHCAAEGGHERCVRVLLRAGAIVDTPNSDGSTALHLVRILET